MTDSNLALTQVVNKLYKINFNIAFQSSFPSRVIFEKKIWVKIDSWSPEKILMNPHLNERDYEQNETLLNTGLLSYQLHTFWKISMHDYVNITTPPPSPTHQMTSEYPLQTKQCHVYFFLIKTKLFLLGKIFGTLDRGIGSSNEKKTIFRTLYNIVNYF